AGRAREARRNAGPSRQRSKVEARWLRTARSARRSGPPVLARSRPRTPSTRTPMQRRTSARARKTRSASTERALVDVAPAPRLPQLCGGDDRVPGRPEVGGGVLVRRVVAATDVAARQALAQVDPRGADLHAVLAPARRPRDGVDLHLARVLARVGDVDV